MTERNMHAEAVIDAAAKAASRPSAIAHADRLPDRLPDPRPGVPTVHPVHLRQTTSADLVRLPAPLERGGSGTPTGRLRGVTHGRRAELAVAEQGSLVTEYGLLAVVAATIAGVVISWSSGGALVTLFNALLRQARALVGA